jgi:hypothetical protein
LHFLYKKSHKSILKNQKSYYNKTLRIIIKGAVMPEYIIDEEQIIKSFYAKKN